MGIEFSDSEIHVTPAAGVEVTLLPVGDALAQVDRINRDTLRYYGVMDVPVVTSRLFPLAQPDIWEFVD